MVRASLARELNRSVVLAALLDAKEIDRAGLVTRTAVSQPTVSRIVDALLEEGVIVETDASRRSGPGREARLLRANTRSALAVGVDLGGTHCRILIADALGTPMGRRRLATPHALSGPELADWLAGEIFDLVVRHGGGAELGSVAIGLPGAVAGDKDRVVNSVNLPQIKGTAFIEALAAATGVPTAIDNDSNLALRGELMYGAGGGDDTVVMFILGTGTSAAVSVEGEILSGRDGALGEFGRLPIDDGPRRMRDLLSDAGLRALAREEGLGVEDPRELFAHPERFRALLDRIHAALQHLVDIVALAYQPQTVLIAGGMSGAFDDEVFARITSRTHDRVGVLSPLRRAALGDDAGLYGALGSAVTELHAELGVHREHLGMIGRDPARVIAAFDACPVEEGTDAARAVGVGEGAGDE